MTKLVIFDLDGTLTDPMVGITSSVQYALEKFGIHVKYLKDLIPFIGPPLYGDMGTRHMNCLLFAISWGTG